MDLPPPRCAKLPTARSLFPASLGELAVQPAFPKLLLCTLASFSLPPPHASSSSRGFFHRVSRSPHPTKTRRPSHSSSSAAASSWLLPAIGDLPESPPAFPAMDLPFGAGEGRPSLPRASPSLSSPAVGPGFFFAASSSRGVASGIHDAVQRVEVSPGLITEIVQRELLKQRIREDIIAREMPEMRRLEEEVRRELEVERALAMGRFQLGALSSVGGVAAVPEGRAPVAPQLGVGVVVERTAGTRPVGGRLDNMSVFWERIGGGRPQPGVLDGRSMKNLALLQNNYENEGLASASAAPVVNTSKVDVGIKRKLDDLPVAAKDEEGAPLGLAKADWSCALCRVSINNWEALQEHLRGRKHKNNRALLSITKELGSSTSTTTTKKPKKALTNPAGKNAVNKEAGVCRREKLQQTGNSLWCELCKVACSSNKTLATHIGGKKHRTRMRAAELKNATTAAVAEKTGVDIEQNRRT
ncbi:hypothetical protein Taro_040063 [Colocasia esculenta]|uniref:C2H2-type domain-containing protein n=1 Tax=Colocasia esculenta TaxID=4460 RepID=A0A843W7Z9_COLES|nr:hypothetical protein [Colocasia esculenta]